MWVREKASFKWVSGNPIGSWGDDDDDTFHNPFQSARRLPSCWTRYLSFPEVYFRQPSSPLQWHPPKQWLSLVLPAGRPAKASKAGQVCWETLLMRSTCFELKPLIWSVWRSQEILESGDKGRLATLPTPSFRIYCCSLANKLPSRFLPPSPCPSDFYMSCQWAKRRVLQLRQLETASMQWGWKDFLPFPTVTPSFFAGNTVPPSEPSRLNWSVNKD